MKKLILIAALMFGGFITANAQESKLDKILLDDL